LGAAKVHAVEKGLDEISCCAIVEVFILLLLKFNKLVRKAAFEGHVKACSLGSEEE
jgi:hypothetical protein